MKRLKSAEVHQGLDMQETRDFLAKAWRDALYQGAAVSEEGERALRIQLAEIKDKLAASARFRGIENVMGLKGWSWHDVSDNVSDYDAKTFMGFVGTKGEREKRFK